jgi:hypothetical protein
MVTLSKKNVASSEVYVGGKLDKNLSDWFAERLKDVGLGAG